MKKWKFNKVKLMIKMIKIKSISVKNLKYLTVEMLNFNKNYNKEEYKEKVK